MSVLGRLSGALRGEGGLLAGATRDPPPGAAAVHGRAAAAGPRATGREAELELIVEAIREGYEAHYASPRMFGAGVDPDLALLAGDHLYAFALARLAELGDLDAIAELADVIALSAQAQAAGDADLAEAVWDAGAHAVGWGSSDAHEAAKRAARAGSPEAAAALRAAARQLRPGRAPGPLAAPPPPPASR